MPKIKKNLLRDIYSYVIFILGLMLILVGVPSILLPPPFAFGIILVVTGFMLTTTSIPGRNLWKYLRGHWNWFGKKTTVLHFIVRDKVEKRMQQKISNKLDPYSRMLITLDIALKNTRPKKM